VVSSGYTCGEFEIIRFIPAYRQAGLPRLPCRQTGRQAGTGKPVVFSNDYKNINQLLFCLPNMKVEFYGQTIFASATSLYPFRIRS